MLLVPVTSYDQARNWPRCLFNHRVHSSWSRIIQYSKTELSYSIGVRRSGMRKWQQWRMHGIQLHCGSSDTRTCQMIHNCVLNPAPFQTLGIPIALNINICECADCVLGMVPRQLNGLWFHRGSSESGAGFKMELSSDLPLTVYVVCRTHRDGDVTTYSSGKHSRGVEPGPGFVKCSFDTTSMQTRSPGQSAQTGFACWQQAFRGVDNSAAWTAEFETSQNTSMTILLKHSGAFYPPS